MIAVLNGILWDEQIFNESELQVCKSVVESVMTCDGELCDLNAKLNAKLL